VAADQPKSLKKVEFIQVGSLEYETYCSEEVSQEGSGIQRFKPSNTGLLKSTRTSGTGILSDAILQLKRHQQIASQGRSEEAGC